MLTSGHVIMEFWNGLTSFGLVFLLLELGDSASSGIFQSLLSCGFESDTCHWTTHTSNRALQWMVHHGRSPTYHSGPEQGHTGGSGGGYLFLDTQYEITPVKVTLRSPNIVSPTNTCLSFWYMLHGYDLGELSVFRRKQGGHRTKLSSKFGHQGKRWYHALVSTGYGFFKLYIEATYNSQLGMGSIAIDDVTVSNQGDCPDNATDRLRHQPHVDCDFEYDTCGWTLDRENHLAWRKQEVPRDTTDRNAVNPLSDGKAYIQLKKTGNFRYKYLELRSPTVSVARSEACLHFWYQKYGSLVETFKVAAYAHEDNYYDVGRPLLSLNESHAWTEVYLTIPQGKNFVIAFKTYSTPHAYRETDSKVAIDDLTLTHGGPCRRENILNCDFETNFCRWFVKTKTDEKDWVRTTGPTPNNFTGPSNDHTTGEGHYIYMDGSTTNVANLYSPKFSVNENGACLNFWTYMHGEDVYRLELLYQGDGMIKEFILEGNQEDAWVQQTVSLPKGSNGNLVFSAKRTYFPRADIALDDISLSESACEQNTITEATLPDEKQSTLEPIPDATTSPTRLAAFEAPTAIALGQVDPVFVRSHVELLCQTDESPETFSWFHQRLRDQKQTSPQDDLPKYHKRTSGEKKLVFEEIQMQNSGFYFCVISSARRPHSPESNGVFIQVVPDPRPAPELFLEGASLDDGPLEVNRQVNLTCGDQIEGGVYHWKTTSQAFPSLPNSRILKINDTQSKYDGVYSCHISKDGYGTSKSNHLEINTKPGKACYYSWECAGEAYADLCNEKRCKCSSEADISGRECRIRPKTPTIRTVLGFLEFGFGESFYFVCDAHEPVPRNLIYVIEKDNATLAQSRIMRISHASDRDTADYSCYVIEHGLRSRKSAGLSVLIKNFTDLTCDFTTDLCRWTQKQSPGLAHFSHVTPIDKGGKDSVTVHSGPYMELEKGVEKVPTRAVLQSPAIDRTTSESCLAFWYKMQGLDAFSLSVWKFSRSGRLNGTQGSKLWTVVGPQGDEWLHHKVTVPQGRTLTLEFEAIGNVAIDDVTLIYRQAC